jgi:hypothetical protein
MESRPLLWLPFQSIVSSHQHRDWIAAETEEINSRWMSRWPLLFSFDFCFFAFKKSNGRHLIKFTFTQRVL